MRDFAVLQNELARQATVLLACEEAVQYFDGALESMRAALALEPGSDGANDKQLQGLTFRALCMKPALHLLQVAVCLNVLQSPSVFFHVNHPLLCHPLPSGGH